MAIPPQMTQEAAVELEKGKQVTNDVMKNYIMNPSGGFIMYGSAEEQANQAANLSQVGTMTGQNLFQTGAQQQDYLSSLEARRAGGDAVGRQMMEGRNRNMANMGRQFAGKGIAGGVAGAAMNSAQNTADKAINAQAQGFARTNDKDLFDYVKRQQKVEGEALSVGKEQGLAQNMNISAPEGLTVICTELHRQGLMDEALYSKDHEFGEKMWSEQPMTMLGYTLLANPVVKRMQKSPKVTKFVAFFALSWARHIAGDKNLLGAFILTAGVPLCRIYGQTRYTSYLSRS